MLVISRRPDEAILIGDDIRLMLTQVACHVVTYKITTPTTEWFVSRELLEPFYLSKDIFIQALSVRGSWVRIGIDAPRDVPIEREERIEVN